MDIAAQEASGCWFDPIRQRWRVRLYLKGRVYHLSYHKVESVARQKFIDASLARTTAVPKKRVPLARTDTASLLLTLLDTDY